MKNWSIIIVKGIVFISLFSLIDLGIGRLFMFAKDTSLNRHPDDMWLKTSYTVEKVNTDCVIIGSSTAEHNYIPEEFERNLGISTYNCGQGGCFFRYGCCLINTIIERYNPKLIIFDIGPNSLLDSDTRDEYQNMRYLSYYYDQNSIIKDYINGKSTNTKMFYNLNCYRYNSHLVYALSPIFHNTSTQKGYIPAPATKDVPQKKQTEWTGDWNETELIELFNTINHCKEKGVEIMVVTSPYYADYDSSVSDKCDDFADKLRKHDVEYINLLYASPFNDDSSLFRDAAHLNTKGAMIMTDTIIKSVNSLFMNKEL